MKYYHPLTDSVSSAPQGWAIPLWEDPAIFPNGAFSNNYQFVWDSVSYNALIKCPRYYNWTIREGWCLNPPPDTLYFGFSFHKCKEVWYKLRTTNLSREEITGRLVRLAGLFGERLQGFQTVRTKETLIRTVVWYIDHYWEDKAEITYRADGTPAAEYSIATAVKDAGQTDLPGIPLLVLNGLQLYLAGHFDRVVSFLGDIFVSDYKTSAHQLDQRFFDQYKPDAQVLLYLTALHILAGTVPAIPEKPKGLLLDGIQLGVNFSRFNRSIINYSTMEIDAFLLDLESWIEFAFRCTDRNHWPANFDSCLKFNSLRDGGHTGCMFRKVCAETPAKHERLLSANFERSTWDPTVER